MTLKTEVLLTFLLVWLCIDISFADEEEPEEIGKNKFKLDISGISVKITCPPEANNLKKNDLSISNNGVYTYDKFSTVDNGIYKCDNKLLYLHAYVCETCTEVSIVMVAGILIADSLLTFGVSVLIYFGCKGKSARSEIAPGGRNRGNKERPPPVPNPDYEPLQKGRQAVYDGLNKNYK